MDDPPPTYQHRFQVHTPLADVAEFHRCSASMPAITPPPIIIRLHHPHKVLSDGDEMDFTMWLGPLPVHWRARIEGVSPTGFTDRQVLGPFAVWVHRHRFVVLDEHTTEVLDEVTLRLQNHLLWGPIGFGMRAGLPALFAYRAWKTKRMLE